MPTTKNAERTEARKDSVVMSVRLWPDVEAGFRELAAATGLSHAALLANALKLLRADAGVQDLIRANRAYDEAHARIGATKPASRKR